MVNTRQRMTNAGHTRREFRQLQQQHRETDSTGGGRFETTRQHRAGQVVDEDGVPYIITDGSSRGNSGPELPSAYIAFKALLTARLLAGRRCYLVIFCENFFMILKFFGVYRRILR